MNSSTSSFKTELRVVGLVLVCLIWVEFSIRRSEVQLSWDTAHVRSIPQVAQQFSPDKTRGVLFLGNSLFRTGIDTDELQRTLKDNPKRGVVLAKVTPSGSSVSEWYYYLKRYFVRGDHMPDLLVIGFANEHFADQTDRHALNLGRYCCAPEDMAQVFQEDLPGFDARVAFTAAMLSASYANRDWVRRNLLERCVPHYRDSAGRMNEVLWTQAQRESQRHGLSYRHLTRLLTLARESRLPVVLVAMPTTTHYGLDPQMCRLAEAQGAQVLDLRDLPGLSADHFMDALHLNAAGAKLFSQALAREIDRMKAQFSASR